MNPVLQTTPVGALEPYLRLCKAPLVKERA